MNEELRLLLDATMLDEGACDTALLVAADWCAERDMHREEFVLRKLAANPDRLATGSRVYGTPGADSDWDWAILCDKTEFERQWALAGKADSFSGGHKEHESSPMIESAARFGPINVIQVSEKEQLAAWRLATHACWRLSKMKGRLTRDESVAAFKLAESTLVKHSYT